MASLDSGVKFPDIDRVIHEPARLAILSVLGGCGAADFLFLENATGLSRGNLSVQLTKLEEAGLIKLIRQIVKGGFDIQGVGVAVGDLASPDQLLLAVSEPGSNGGGDVVGTTACGYATQELGRQILGQGEGHFSARHTSILRISILWRPTRW